MFDVGISELALIAVVALIVLAVLLLTLDQGGLLGSFRSQVQTLLTPLQEEKRNANQRRS